MEGKGVAGVYRRMREVGVWKGDKEKDSVELKGRSKVINRRRKDQGWWEGRNLR